MNQDLQVPEGYLWVCFACGKTRTHKFPGQGVGTPGWDESCLMNSSLVKKELLVFGGDGQRVVEVLPERDTCKFDAEGTCLQCRAKLGEHHKMSCSFGQGPVTIPETSETEVGEMDLEEEFEKLAQDVSGKAARIKCSMSDYRDGLRQIIDHLKMDISASEESDPDL